MDFKNRLKISIEHFLPTSDHSIIHSNPSLQSFTLQPSDHFKADLITSPLLTSSLMASEFL